MERRVECQVLEICVDSLVLGKHSTKLAFEKWTIDGNGVEPKNWLIRIAVLFLTPHNKGELVSCRSSLGFYTKIFRRPFFPTLTRVLAVKVLSPSGHSYFNLWDGFLILR